MDLNKQYEVLAAQLGDIAYKQHLLDKAKVELIKQIEKLDELAGMMKEGKDAQTEQAQAESLSD